MFSWDLCPVPLLAHVWKLLSPGPEGLGASASQQQVTFHCKDKVRPPPQVVAQSTVTVSGKSPQQPIFQVSVGLSLMTGLREQVHDHLSLCPCYERRGLASTLGPQRVSEDNGSDNPTPNTRFGLILSLRLRSSDKTMVPFHIWIQTGGEGNEQHTKERRDNQNSYLFSL